MNEEFQEFTTTMLNLNAANMQMLGTLCANAGAQGIFNAHQAHMNLAASATGNESMSDAARLAAYDKAVALQGIQAQTLYFAGQAMAEAGRAIQKKDTERQQRMIANGAIFVS